MTITAVIIVLSVLSVSLTICYLDARYNLQLMAWMSGEVSNPFKAVQFSGHQQAMSRDSDEIASLKARIEVLETIVTAPAYELNQKLNEL